MSKTIISNVMIFFYVYFIETFLKHNKNNVPLNFKILYFVRQMLHQGTICLSELQLRENDFYCPVFISF